MKIHISNSSGEPIYAQIAVQVKQQILNGSLSEGDGLPSMRLLAKELRVSLITTKRAYEELEQDGFIVTVMGKGSFVATKNRAWLREEHLKTIEKLLQEVVSSARLCQVSEEELKEMLELIYRGED